MVPGATLTLTNTVTGEKQVRVTNDVGVYNFNALPAAPFELEVKKENFATKVLDHVQLIPEQANALNIQLEVGAQAQTVQVDASLTTAIDTETASGMRGLRIRVVADPLLFGFGVGSLSKD